ncbi:hypothetical protein ES332_A05G300600v1 [Gossypium tomentosum]|uniref:Knottin scorpion toxin-like domain-containing protein n=1 Tax=Gossypium tomentosum TaxID=34277 RepID=A0A5D2QM83_GOSTO|nr:hypothetical protein ES332_A05G300600v1 [Gossypium tomentosum]
MLLLASSGEARELLVGKSGGRCIEVMDPKGCNLVSCKQQCLQLKNGNGVCLANVKQGYQCVCYINC